MCVFVCMCSCFCVSLFSCVCVYMCSEYGNLCNILTGVTFSFVSEDGFSTGLYCSVDEGTERTPTVPTVGLFWGLYPPGLQRPGCR